MPTKYCNPMRSLSFTITKFVKKKFNMELNRRKKVVRGDPVFTEFLHAIFLMKNRKMDFDFGHNFSGFLVWLLLTNERASDGNIWGAYTRGSKEDLESVFKKIPYEHTSELHYKILTQLNILFKGPIDPIAVIIFIFSILKRSKFSVYRS